MRRARGFTLLEVLAAMALLALLLVGIWSGLHAATDSVHRGERVIRREDAQRAAQRFLRQEIQQARPLPFARTANGDDVVFRGHAQQMTCIAPLPGYLGRLGPQWQQVRLVPASRGKGLQLEVTLKMLPPDGSAPRAIGKPQILLSGIRSGHFDYRGFNPQHQPQPWSSRWKHGSRLPALVRLQLVMNDGSIWPTLVIPLRVDGSAANTVTSAFSGGTP